MKADECKQGEDCGRVGVGLAIACRMGTGGRPDSAGTSHARIYHSAAVTAGQGTDVSAYLRATSDGPSLAFAPAALPTWPPRATREGASVSKKKKERSWEVLSLGCFGSILLDAFPKHLKVI